VARLRADGEDGPVATEHRPGTPAAPGEHLVGVDGGHELWVRESGDPAGSSVLLVMGAASSGVAWPEALVSRLGRRHRVVVWDHRDTGRSTRAFDERPYALRDLAGDAVAVLDALGVDRAHAVGMSLGGLLVQLLLLDHPDRLHSATLFCTGALPGAPGAEVPGPSEELLALWATLGDARDEAAELEWRVEHWRVLNGDQVPFDAAEFRELEQRVIAHGGPPDAGSATAHARAGTEGLDRGAELAAVTTPVLVVEAPADPAYPPPNAEHLQRAIGCAHRVQVPGMGHALSGAVLAPFGDALEAHLDAVDAMDAAGR
jgi:pimeloyl-ACP methyl ester carboxylesterase